jgi:hypothetical protein
VRFGGDACGQHKWEECSLLKALAYDLGWFLFWTLFGLVSALSGAGFYYIFQRLV